MPETWFNVRWPDDTHMRCYSPSSTVVDYFDAGQTYEMTEFVSRARSALTHAGDRVRAKYGYACSASAEQLAVIERTAQTYSGYDNATVVVEGFER